MKYRGLDNALDNKIDTQKISSKHDLCAGKNAPPDILADFNDFKSSIEGKIDNLSNLVSSIDSVSRTELSKKLNELEDKIKESKFDTFAFDSARRTFGEEIGVLKSFVDKSIVNINGSIESLDNSDSIEQLKLSTDKQIKKLNDALAEQSKQTQELKRLLSLNGSSEKSIK